MNQLSTDLVTGLESEIQNKKSRLVLYYKPLVCLRSGEIYGLEGLVHLMDHQKGLSLYNEPSGNLSSKLPMLLLHDWLLHQVYNHNIYFTSFGLNLPISVTIRVDDFENPLFRDFINKFLSKVNTSNFRLTLNIINISNIESIESLIGTIHDLKTNNIKVSLGNFDPDCANIDIINRIPFSSVTIHESFVCNMLKSDKKLNFMKSIIHFVKSKDMEVISKGVNSIDEAKLLLEAGCNIVQGLGITKAMNHLNIPFWVKKCDVEGDWWKRLSNMRLSP